MIWTILQLNLTEKLLENLIQFFLQQTLLLLFVETNSASKKEIRTV